MSQLIHVDQLDSVVQQILEEYGEEVKADVVEVTEKVAKEAKDTVENAAPVGARKGKYKKNIDVKQTQDSALETQHTVYVKDPEYRLTHLLEFGHATADGTGRTKEIKHWQNGQDYVDQNFEKELRDKIERG